MTEASANGLRVGEVVGERYRVVSMLGAGGMGTVYRVEHTLMAKDMAMKLLRPELSTVPQIVERFEREARSASRLDNPHIVRVTDFGRAQSGALFLVMELLDGESLTSRLASKGALSLGEAFQITDQILSALEHAHANGVVHRDLKPDNTMLVVRDGRVVVKILDFGLAKLTSQEEASAPSLTQAGMVFGTPRYMAPEQAAAEAIDERTDLYSVGVILYEMLAGHPPFQQASAMDLLTAHLTQAPPSFELKIDNPELAKQVMALIMKALSKHKKDRFASASEFRAALAACESLGPELFAVALPRSRSFGDPKLAETLVRGAPSTSVRPLLEGAPRKKAPMIAAGAVLLAVAAGALMFRTSSESEAGLKGRAERALAMGDLPAARAILGQLVAKDARDPRTQVLQGHVAFADGDLEGASSAYRAALEIDGSVTRDPLLLANARRIIDKKPKEGGLLLKTIALHPDPSAAEFLAELTKSAPTAVMKNHAFQALDQLGELGRIDAVAYLSDALQETKSCSSRKWLVDKLVPVDDPRVLKVLKREKERRSGLFGLESANGCMAAELDAHIARLERKR